MPETDNKNSLEIRSEEVKDILGHIPHWIVRWGTFLFLCAILIIIGGSWFIRYPYIVSSNIYVTTHNPPSNAVARTNGRIEKLFVEDNETVSAGQILAIIENSTDFNELIELKKSLDKFRIYLQSLDNDTVFNFPGNLVLGEIQTSYANFLKQYVDLQNFKNLDYHEKKIASIQQEIGRYHAYSWTLKKQSTIIKGEEGLVQRQFSRDSTLFSQGVIPEADFEKSKSALLQKKRAYEESRSILVNNEIQISKLEQQVLDLKLHGNGEIHKLQISVIEAFDNLMGDIADWEQKYLLRAKIDGTISFTRIWSENQNVREGELVMTVIPKDAGEIIGKMDLQIAGSGKVKVGQNVNIKFANYPYMEYGMVKGKITSISQAASDNAYSVLVNFPEGLKTTYNTNIDFAQDMQGQAEIITDEVRLLERIYNPVKAVISRQRGYQ
jgi:HlyD family secretion protein